MFVVNHRKIFYAISAVLLVISVFSVLFWGLKPGIDFAGGSQLKISYSNHYPSAEQLKNKLADTGYPDVLVRSAGSEMPEESNFIIQTKEISQEEKNAMLRALVFEEVQPVEKTFSTVGPLLGKEAIYKSWLSIVLVMLAIVLFIAFAFRKVSKPVSSWVYGLVTVFALLHDVLVPTGIFALLGHFYGFEVDTLFVTALLVILGFSVHDTIVVFDRVRENLHKNEDQGGKKDFPTIVGESIKETFIRSINTSLTTLLAILVLYLVGPETVRHFSLTLLLGISVGTYSSIFIAAPLLVTINNGWKNKRLT